MLIADLFENYVAEAGPQLVVLYSGRFQPFHLGHGEVFHELQSKFGRDNVYIATSNKVELPKSPFNFSEKVQFMHAAGIPSDRIIQVVSPYKLPEPQFNPANTIFIVAVGAPDRDRLRPDSVKKDGNPGYYKTFESLDRCETADKHGYVIVINEKHKVIALGGKKVDVSHGTPARAVWNEIRNNPKLRSEYLLQMFGRDDNELGKILDKIPTTVSEETDPELRSVVDYAVSHYPNVHTRGEAFMKFVQRSLKHGLETDIDQQKVISSLYDRIKSLEQELKKIKSSGIKEEAAGVGVVASKKQAKDPRYLMSLTKDIRPGEVDRQLRKMHLADSTKARKK